MKNFERAKAELGEEYDEAADEYEIIERYKEYERDCAELLKLIDERDETAALLKIAAPAKIADVRAVVAAQDKLLEEFEECVRLSCELYEKSVDCWKADVKLARIMEEIQPALLKHVAENQPDRLAEIQALFADDEGEARTDGGTDKSH